MGSWWFLKFCYVIQLHVIPWKATVKYMKSVIDINPTIYLHQSNSDFVFQTYRLFSSWVASHQSRHVSCSRLPRHHTCGWSWCVFMVSTELQPITFTFIVCTLVLRFPNCLVIGSQFSTNQSERRSCWPSQSASSTANSNGLTCANFFCAYHRLTNSSCCCLLITIFSAFKIPHANFCPSFFST